MEATALATGFLRNGFGLTLGAVACLAAAGPAVAQDVEAISVWGRRADALGRAMSASEGRVAFSDFAVRPLSRPGELAEVVPGLAATQHSGAGKANQYFLRGFNLDHGTDFATWVAGVPVNMPTHAHGEGVSPVATPSTTGTTTPRAAIGATTPIVPDDRAE